MRNSYCSQTSLSYFIHILSYSFMLIAFTDFKSLAFVTPEMSHGKSPNISSHQDLRSGPNSMIAQICSGNEVNQYVRDLQDFWKQSNAKYQLVNRCGHAAIPFLIESFQTQTNPTVRKTTAEIIAYIGGAEAIEALTTALKNDPSPIVRKTAADGLVLRQCKKLGLY